MKRCLLMAIVFLLVFASTTFISGAKPENTPKEEVVYGMLNSAGQLKSISVVNGFNLNKPSTIADYGNYATVENLSSGKDISQSGNFISLESAGGRTSYKGTLENRQLPWLVHVKYYLDGMEINPERLAGQSGKLRIKVTTAKNPDVGGNFFRDFALQITIPLKMEGCKHVSTTGATIGEVGGTKQYSYVVLPGKKGSIELTATVSDFEMDSITLGGVRMNFDLPMDIRSFQKGLDQLVRATAKLDNGALGLVKGAKALNAGMSDYTKGFKSLVGKLDQLQTGASKLNDGMSDLSNGLSALSNQGAALRDGAANIQQSVFDSANAQLAGTGLPPLTVGNYSAILDDNPMFDGLRQQLDQITEFVAGINSYTLGTTQLSQGATALSGGAADLSHGIDTLAGGLGTLYSGSVQLNDGMKTFLQGVYDYRAGTRTFKLKTSKMESSINKQLDSMLSLLSDEGKVYQSFVSKENTNVNFVQFILKTDSVAKKASAPAKEPTPQKESLWQKFLDLFR